MIRRNPPRAGRYSHLVALLAVAAGTCLARAQAPPVPSKQLPGGTSGALDENVTLPDLQTQEGIMARMLLAESQTPAFNTYNRDRVRLGMQAMRNVVVNRLNNDPSQFGAPNATTWTDIIVAPNQFAGFPRVSGQVRLSAAVTARIDEIMRRANEGRPGLFARHVQDALEMANPGATIADPFAGLTMIGGVPVIGGSFGWRTEGSTSPGGRFVAIPADGNPSGVISS